MRKIRTLFEHDPLDRRHVMPSVTPGCEWVMRGEGRATVKWDGTCVYYDGERWWVRREVKPDKTPPRWYWPLQTDPVTGKTVGWEPAEQSGFAKFLHEAADGREWGEGTYELCGPKINGNPDELAVHKLIRHGGLKVVVPDHLSFNSIRDTVLGMSNEGIVWHHPDGRMAKIKRRDFI